MKEKHPIGLNGLFVSVFSYMAQLLVVRLVVSSLRAVVLPRFSYSCDRCVTVN